MYFPAAETNVPIPTKDLLSWTFDDVNYDRDEPISYSILFLGIIAAGGVYAGTNPSYTEFELIHHVKTSKAKFLITEPEMLKFVLDAAKECSIPETKVWIFDVLGQPLPNGFRSWKGLLNHGEEDWVRFGDEKICKETTAARLFSSGTTGHPKAVMLSHHNFISEHTLVVECKPRPWKTRRLICTPMFHAACVPLTHTSALRSGHVTVIMRRFELEPFLATIEKFQITDLVLAPPIVITVIMSAIKDKYSLKSLRELLIGAAPLGRASQARLEQLLSKGATCNQVWGMTEMSCISSMFQYPEDDDTGSVGRPLPNIDFKIIDDNSNDITTYDIQGKLYIHGPVAIKGYFKNPKANTKSFDSEGFFKTRDIVYYNSKSKKKWYIVNQKKELIKVRRFQVAPPELETILLSHPHIIDTAVIKVKFPSDPNSKHPRAYCVKRSVKESEELDEKAVKKWCGERLARFKELTGGVRFIDNIPKNASGKILKRLLREQAKEELELGEDKARL